MKFLDLLEISAASIILMGYGWYLGQSNQSMQDLAGILLFITGLLGLGVAFVIYYLTRKYSWHNKWFANLLSGFAGCAAIFIIIVIYSRMQG